MLASRRESLWMLPALLAGAPVFAVPSRLTPLPSHLYRFAELPVHGGGAAQTRSVLQGATHSGFPIELHETDLAPGARPHPPHHHVHEEIFMIRAGTVEVAIAGQSAQLGPGGVAYVGSNQQHGIRNAGSEHAQYFVLALGSDRA